MQSIVDANAFGREQKCLAHVWTFLGLTLDAPHDGDWFVASIATRSVFVQRFGTELRGFENQCAHRLYPIRNEPQGRGPLECSYHHWQYDSEGRAVGIPHAKVLFGALPQELCARLKRIELAIAGTLIFGRFPSSVDQSFEDFIGDGMPFLETATQVKGHLQRLNYDIRANWRLCVHISLDDYHSPAVHPASFGREGYLHRKNLTYRQFGQHNAFLATPRPNSWETLIERCAKGEYRPTHYTIVNIIPNLFVVLTRIDFSYFYGVVLAYEAVRHDLTKARVWIYPAPFPTHNRWLQKVTDPIRALVVRHLADRIFREDNIVCERLQQAAPHMQALPRIGGLEERILWFEESYHQLILEGAKRACVTTDDRNMQP